MCFVLMPFNYKHIFFIFIFIIDNECFKGHLETKTETCRTTKYVIIQSKKKVLYVKFKMCCQNVNVNVNVYFFQ